MNVKTDIYIKITKTGIKLNLTIYINYTTFQQKNQYIFLIVDKLTKLPLQSYTKA